MAGFRTGAGRCTPEISVGRIMNVQPDGRTAILTLRTRSTVRSVDHKGPSLYRQRRAFEVLVPEGDVTTATLLSSTSGAAHRVSLIEATSSTKTVCPLLEHHRRNESHLTGARRAMRAGLRP